MPRADAAFEYAWTFLQDLEGWGADHTVRGDPGGRTIWGISENNHPHMFRNGPPNEAQAREFYREVYWEPLRLGEVRHPKVQAEILEFAVHTSTPEPHKPNVAVRAAQTAANRVHAVTQGIPQLILDGRMGDKTINALNEMPEGVAILAWEGVFNKDQLLYYRSLRRSLVDQFLVGWTRRVEF